MYVDHIAKWQPKVVMLLLHEIADLLVGAKLG